MPPATPPRVELGGGAVGLATCRGITLEERNGRAELGARPFVGEGSLLSKERLGVFHRVRTARVSAL
jgi:hypothetical protein